MKIWVIRLFRVTERLAGNERQQWPALAKLGENLHLALAEVSPGGRQTLAAFNDNGVRIGFIPDAVKWKLTQAVRNGASITLHDLNGGFARIAVRRPAQSTAIAARLPYAD